MNKIPEDLIYFEANPALQEFITAMIAAKKEFGNLEKSKKNPQFGSQYSTLQDIHNCIDLGLSNNGLLVMQPIIWMEDKQFLYTRVLHISGQGLGSLYEIGDKVAGHEKNTPIQRVGSAISYLRRYVLLALFGLEGEVDDDGEFQRGTGGSQKSQGSETGADQQQASGKKKPQPEQQEKMSKEAGERFRKATFDLMVFRNVPEETWKLLCYDKYKVDSRAKMTPEQWKDFFDIQRAKLDERDGQRYTNRLTLFGAIKNFKQHEIDPACLEQYLKLRFILPVLYDLPDISPITSFLTRALKPDGLPKLKIGIAKMLEWFEALGGSEEVFLMVETLNNLSLSIDSPEHSSDFLKCFFKRMLVEEKKGYFFLTDIRAVAFKAWPEAIKIAAASIGVEWEKNPGEEEEEEQTQENPVGRNIEDLPEAEDDILF